jgi:hypothetical protein
VGIDLKSSEAHNLKDDELVAKLLEAKEEARPGATSRGS